jgi:hypothetical protein
MTNDDEIMRELARKHNTDPSKLDPEVLAGIEETIRWADEQYAAGTFAPSSVTAKQNYPIGLDDDYVPFRLNHVRPYEGEEPSGPTSPDNTP